MNAASQASFAAAGLANAELLLWPALPEQALALINRMLAGRPPALTEQSDDVRLFKDIRMELRKMTVDQDGRRVELTRTEYELLLYFINSDGSVLTRETLLHAVWGLNYFGGSNLVDAHIKSLRKKLKDSAATPRYIATVRGAGYRLAD
jgi:two-component system alkaline phosphatase synthesis response regulator PhoP